MFSSMFFGCANRGLRMGAAAPEARAQRRNGEAERVSALQPRSHIGAKKGDAGSNSQPQKPSTDDSGGFLNPKTGEVLDAGAMLRLFSWAELLQVPVGRRPVPRQRLA